MSKAPQNTHNDSKTSEMISAWLDGELDRFEANHGFEKASASLEQVERYQLMGQLMRQEAVDPAVSLTASIIQAIESEATYGAPIEQNEQSNQRRSGLWSKLGGVAIAASVAWLALLSTIQPVADQVDSPQTLAAVTTNTATPLLNSAPVEPSVEQRQELQTLHDMFVTHQQIAQMTGVNGLPTVRVVSNRKAVPVTVNAPARAQETSPEQETDDSTESKNDKK